MHSYPQEKEMELVILLMQRLSKFFNWYVLNLPYR